MRVTVWHNTGGGFNGHHPEDPMLRVFSYIASNGDPMSELWRAVEAFNADLDMLAGTSAELAHAYRARNLRSFSIGDGLSILSAPGHAERFWTSTGYSLDDHTGPYPTLGLHPDHGSTPLGRLVHYRLRADPSHILRKGLFECAPYYAVSAVAELHGLTADDIAIADLGPRAPA